MGAPVENFCDRLERFLASSVPDLKLKRDALHLNEQTTELDSNRDLVVLSELVVAHSVHETGLTDTTVSNYNQLEEEVLLRLGWSSAL